MKVLKWLLLGTLVLLGLVALLVALAPTLFGDRIRSAVDAELAHYIDAEVSYGDVDLSLLREFPKLTVVVEDVQVDGQGVFDSTRLVRLEELAVSLDFWSAIGYGPVQVHSVEFVKPDLHVLTLADGTTNTNILRNLEEASEAASEPSESVEVGLSQYSITGGNLLYEDRAADLLLRAESIDHSGSGDFTATQFDLSTLTEIGALSLTTNGVTYLRQASARYEADLAVDTEQATITLADNSLTLNELQLSAEGVVGLPAENGAIPIDLSFTAPAQGFRSIWSVLPASFAKELDGVQTSGSFTLAGTIDGTYLPEPQSLPAFTVDLRVDNASVRYPDLPKAITQINLRGGIRSAGRDLQDLLVDLPAFSFTLGDNPFSGSLKVRSGLSDPSLDLAAKGRLNLSDLQAALPIEGVEELAGLLTVDLTAAGTASGASKDLRSIDSRGLVQFQDIAYQATGIPRIAVSSGVARFSGSEVALDAVAVQAGSSSFTLSGKLVDPLALLTDTGVLGGSLQATGSLFDANEWLAEQPVAAQSDPRSNEPLPTSPARPFDRFDLAYTVDLDEVRYDVYTLKEVNAKGAVSSERLRFDAGRATLDGAELNLTGELDNLYGYTFDSEELTGLLDLRADQLDLLKLSELGTDPSTAATSAAAPSGYVELPERMTIRISTSVKELLYDDLVLDNVNGVIAIANQGAVIENGVANFLSGQLAIDGGYQYLGATTPPTFDLKYDLKDASFKQAFEKLNTVKQLAPVAQYLSGSFNTNLVMSSTLGEDMLPDLRQLNADGFLATLDATLNNFAPLRKAADLLNIKELKSLDLRNTKNWFTIQDGTVELRPFDVKWAGIDATIGGTHGLDQAMDYEIIALIPREKLGGNVVGDAVNSGLDLLKGQASKLGLDLSAGEFVRVRIGLAGSIDDPKVTVKLLGTEGEGGVKGAAQAAIKDLAQQARDSIERVAQARLDAARAEAEARARTVADSVRNAAEARARAAAQQAQDRAKAEANRLAEQAAQKAKDEAAAEAKRIAEEAAKKAGDDAAEKAKDALKGLFKKKPDN